jgi:hypothetical protein
MSSQTARLSARSMPLRVAEVAVQDDLGVRSGVEPVATTGQLGSQLGEVVDLTGVDDHHRPVRRAHAHGLRPAGQVDDRGTYSSATIEH